MVNKKLQGQKVRTYKIILKTCLRLKFWLKKREVVQNSLFVESYDTNVEWSLFKLCAQELKKCLNPLSELFDTVTFH